MASGWEEGKFCLARRVIGGRWVLKIDRDLRSYLDGKVLGGPFGSLEEAQRSAEEMMKVLLTAALSSL